MKKFISIILCLAMVFAMTTGIFAEESKSLNYVSLGSSETLGYGLCGYYPSQLTHWTGTYLEQLAWGFLGWDAPTWNPQAIRKLNMPETAYTNFGIGNDIEGSVGNLVCKELKSRGYTVNYSQLAASVLRAQDLLLFLYENLGGDIYQNLNILDEDGLINQYIGANDEAAIQSMRQLYQTALKDADIITYDLGSGNFSLSLQSIMFTSEYNYEESYKSIFTEDEYEQYKKYEDLVLNLITRTLKSYGIEVTDEIDMLIDNIAYAFTSYCVAFDKSMEWIFNYNPDATVIVMQIQNLIDGMVMDYNGIELPLGDIMQVLVTTANSYASSLSKYSSKILYSKITDNHRVSFFIDEIANYEGPDDLTEALKELLDLYSYFGNLYIKSSLTPIYENLGKYVYDTNYNDVLNSCYDACVKFIKYIYLSDIPCEVPEDEAFDTYCSIVDALLLDTANGVLAGNGNEEALENAINTFESLDDNVKKLVKFDLYFMNCSTALFHPNYEGHQQMAVAVINTLDNGEAGNQNRITGLEDSVKEMENNIQNIKNFVVNKVTEKVKENVNTVVSTVKDNIDKAIVSPISSIITKIKNLVK